MKTPTPYFKNCPVKECPNIQYYCTRVALNSAIKANRKCMKCAARENGGQNKGRKYNKGIVDNIIRPNKTVEQVQNSWRDQKISGSLSFDIVRMLDISGFLWEEYD